MDSLVFLTNRELTGAKMKISGLMKMTLLDFPGQVACTVFTSGCNFRCPFCHNASLVLPERIMSEELSEADFFAFLEKRTGLLDGVCISGGEPLLQSDIADFIRKIKDRGFKVKLDTNGSVPNVLRALLDEGLLDYVAMDIKNTPEDYAETCGIDDPPVDLIQESVRILLSCAVPFEFRTTVVDELHDEEKMSTVAQWISGAQNYFLQDYTDSDNVIRKGYHSCSAQKMESIRKAVAEYVPSAKLRGI